jgi:hypothetical protein
MGKKEKDFDFPSKYEKKLPTGFKEDADSFDIDKLKQVIIESETNIVTIDREMQQDEKLQGARGLVKDLSASYKEAKSSQTAKIKYCLHLMEGKGVSFETLD